MAASANTAQARFAANSKQVLSFQALPEEDDDDTEIGGASLASILSSELLRGKKAVSICHNGAVYRLQATRLGKLILTK